MPYTKKQLALTIALLLSLTGSVSAETETTKNLQLSKPEPQFSGEVKQRAEMERKAAQEKGESIKRGEGRTTAEEMKKKIATLKDQKKIDQANKIVAQIDRSNKEATKHFANVLIQLEAILTKIEIRITKAASEGKDVAIATDALQKAKVAIANAKVAVTTQQAKTYAINTSTITSDPTSPSGQENLVKILRERFQLLKDQLKKDITTLRDGSMKEAREAVKNVANLIP